MNNIFNDPSYQYFVMITCALFWLFLTDDWMEKHPPKRTLVQMIIQRRYQLAEARYKKWLGDRKDSVRNRQLYGTVVGTLKEKDK